MTNNNTLCSQTVINNIHPSEPIGKMLKWQCSQTVLNGRHPSEPTVKCSKSTLCSKEKFVQVHTDGLTWVWSLSACPGACFHSTKEMCMFAASAERRRLLWFLETNGIPQSPLLGPGRLGQWVLCNHPGHHGRVLMGKCWEPNIARAQPHVGSQSLSAKVGPAAVHLKANKEPRLMERKVCFILQASNQVGRANSCPKADFPHLLLPPTVSRKEIL